MYETIPNIDEKLPRPFQHKANGLPSQHGTVCRNVNMFLLRFGFQPIPSYLCIGKGSARAFPFFSPLLPWSVVRPKWACKRASSGFSVGPDELSSVALLQSRSGRMRILMGQIGIMGQMEQGGETYGGIYCVRLFQKI